LISVINFLKITFRIVLFVGNKFTNLLSRPCKDFKQGKGKIGKYPDFGGKPENILILGKKPENILILWKKPEIILILTRDSCLRKRNIKQKSQMCKCKPIHSN
jgi:hypothetical protein